MSLDRLLAVLHPAVPDLSAEDVADALYLALHLGPAQPEAEQAPAASAASEKSAEPDEPLPFVEQPIEPTQAPAAPADEPLEQAPTLPAPVLPPPSEPVPQAAGLYAGPRSPDPAEAMRFQTPDAPALPGRIELARALRPLLVRVPSRRSAELDEEATVEHSADARLWLPVLRPRREPRFRAVLLLDDSPSMVIWHSAAAELARLLAYHPALRELRAYRLRFSTEEAVLQPGLAREGNAGERPAAGELYDPTGRTLIIIFSDGVGRPWRDGRMAKAVATWGSNTLVSMVHVLPEGLWERSALDRWPAARVSASGIGPPNTRLHYVARRGRMGQPTPSGVPLPVTTLEPAALANWVQLALGTGETSMAAYLATSEHPQAGDATTGGAPPDPEALVALFLGSASKLAQSLGGLLALVAPLNLQVARLVQAALLPETNQLHLAEVWLSGLLRRSPASPPDEVPDEVIYEFYPGVSARLRGLVPASDALAVLRHVSAYIGARLGQPHDWRAWIEAGEPFAANDPRRPFAAIAAEVLHGLGGAYRELASRLARAGGISLGHGGALELPAETPPTEAPEVPRPETPTLPQPLVRYRLIHHLRNTPLAEIHEAHDLLLDRPVHVQLLRMELRDNEWAIQRFKTTASATAFVNHPNVATIYDLGSFEGRPCVAMEPVLTTSLRDEMRRRKQPYSWDEAMNILQQISDALSTAHRSEIIHGGLAPEYIFRRPDGSLAVTNFLGALLPTETLEHNWMGFDLSTARYRAPEVWQESVLYKETDTYALACILSELITGEPLFKGETSLILRQAHLAGTNPRRMSLFSGALAYVNDVLRRGLSSLKKERLWPGAFIYSLKHISDTDDEPTLPPDYQYPPRWELELTEGDDTQFGLYKIKSELVWDRYGQSYHAIHTSLGRPVELKILHAWLAIQPEVVTERFPQLIRMLAKLNHPHIAQIYDAGQIDGRLFIATEVGGDRLKIEPGRDSWDWLFNIFEQIASALDYLHQQGMVHGELMPANIFYRNNVLLVNAAYYTMDKEEVSRNLSVSYYARDRSYGAPELYSAPQPTPASDIYAFALTIYELLAGERLLQPARTALSEVSMQPVRWLVYNVPFGITEVLRRSLAENPAERHPTAKALVDELRALRLPAPPPPSSVSQSNAQSSQMVIPFEPSSTMVPFVPETAPESFNEGLALGPTDMIATSGRVLRLPGYSLDVAVITLDGEPRIASNQMVVNGELYQLRLATSGPLQLSARKSGETPQRNIFDRFLGGLRGQQLAPGYRVRGEIGRGVTAVVYRAYSETLKREVALKVFNAGQDSTARRAQLRNEALALRTLQGTGVVAMHDYGETVEQAWLATELLQGITLRDHLRQKGRLKVGEAVNLLTFITETLQSIHDSSYVYADLKPENIMLNAEEDGYVQVRLTPENVMLNANPVPILIDFGLCRRYNQVEQSQNLERLLLGNWIERQTNQMVGTPSYMAPEIWRGEPASPASDIYALACLLYEILFGEALFKGSSLEEIRQAHEQGPLLPKKWPAGVPPSFRQVLLRALAPYPDRRYPSARAMLYELRTD
jgi:serine/threonine protein kinase